MYMGVLSARCLVPENVRKGRSPGIGVMVFSHHGGTGNQMQILCRSRQCPLTPSTLFHLSLSATIILSVSINQPTVPETSNECLWQLTGGTETDGFLCPYFTGNINGEGWP